MFQDPKTGKIMKGNDFWVGRNHRDESRKKMSLAKKGKKLSSEHKKKISEYHRKIGSTWNIGKKNHFGFNATDEQRKRMSEAHRGIFAKEKNPNWMGGTSKQCYPSDWNDLLRDTIRERDCYVCQMCGVHEEELNGRFRKLDVHHINYNKDDCNYKNLISLCRYCHLKTNVRRDYWQNYFQNFDS